MCGFVTIFDPKGESDLSASQILGMCKQMEHRGPDYCGTYLDKFVGMGHCRLSIIDLSARSNQPYQFGDLTMVYNGEVYNFKEIRRKLSSERGVSFETTSDTEVVLKAYQEYGKDCVNYFNGMFSGIIWDKKRKSIFVFRDRLGVKPLVWIKHNGKYLFASDIKSLWEVISPENVSVNSVRQYFEQGYISFEGTSTNGINKFPPGTTAIISSEECTLERYWSVSTLADTSNNFQYDDIVDETESLLKDAVNIRLRSDVPVGTFLSGGVDSSLVSAFSAVELGEGLHTYSIGFNDSKYDETLYSNEVSKKYHTNHHHKELTEASIDNLPAIVWYFGELFGDSSSLPTYYVSKFAREKLTVVLTGDGADEAFGGYIDPYAMWLREYYRKIPLSLRGVVSKTASLIPSNRMHSLNKFLLIAEQQPNHAYNEFKSGNWGKYNSAFINSESCLSELSDNVLDSENVDTVSQFLHADINNRLCNDFLVKVDMASMANSLEARSPFLDYRMIELGLSLPHAIRYKNLRRKSVLKKIARKYFSHDLVYRRKMGFSIPLYKWLSGSLWPQISNIIDRRSIIDHIMHRNEISRIMTEFANGRSQHATRIWLLLWFQIWDGLFISKIYSRNDRLSSI